MSKKNTLIEIDNLDYSTLFKNLSIKIYDGSYNLVAGPSLSGKSTLLKIIGGLISTNVVIKYSGKEYSSLNRNVLFDNIKYIDLNNKVIFYGNVEDIFLKNLKNKVKNEDITKKYKDIINICDIADVTLCDFNSLNKFNKDKVLVGLSLISDPKCLLIDNLCTFNTKKERKAFENIFNILNKEYGVTIVISSSNLLPITYTDYIYILYKGEIVLNGERDKILREDNKLNKCSLDLPFIYDLSDKLIDYNLIGDMIDDIDRMVNALWK